ncbi:MAG TPA: hypothetical protein VGK71_10930 [Nitrospirota bacterium]|jgi:uncharacterized protein YyaL (SSP411 family)
MRSFILSAAMALSIIMVPGISLAEEMPAQECIYPGTVYELIVVGKTGEKDTEDLVKKARAFDEPGIVVEVLDPVRDAEKLAELGYEYGGGAIMYVCSGKACLPPVAPGGSMDKVRESIRKLRAQEAAQPEPK